MEYLVKDGRFLFSVVKEKNPSQECDFAVEELCYAIGKCCENSPEVLVDEGDLPEHCIYIGDTRKARELGLVPSMDAVGADGYFIGGREGDYFVCAVGKEGLIYGVYELLLALFNVEFFAPDEWKLPKMESEVYRDFGVSARPDIETRVRVLEYSKLDVETERRLGFNTCNGRHWIFWAHSHFEIMPKEKYWDTRRDFYTEDGMQLCLTAPGLVEEATKNIIAKLTPENCAKSDILYIMVGHEDNGTFCDCPRCREAKKKYGGNSGITMRFVNPIADGVTAFMKEHYPTKKVSVVTFGYGTTIDPPVVWNEDNTCTPVDESVIAHENVGVMLAPLGADWGHSLTDFKYNEQTAKSLIGWKAVQPQMFIWTYDSIFDDSFIFIDNWKYLGESYRTFKEYGAVYLFDEGHEDRCFNFWHMRNYVRAKLMWDLSADVEGLIAHFAKNFYKEGEPYVMKYFNSLRKHNEEMEKKYEEEGWGYKQRSYIRAWHDYRDSRFWPKEYLEECIALLEKGRKALKDEGISGAKNRLEIEMLGAVYLYMELYVHELPPEKIRYYHDFFRDVTLRNGSYYYAEHGMTHTLTNEKKMMGWRTYLMKDMEVKYEQE